MGIHQAGQLSLTSPRAFLLAAFLLASASTDAGAIVLRHDRDDARYRDLAADYPMVCKVGGGMGTLITPTWVVTAAHVAEQMVSEVRFGDLVVPVDRTFLHPDYAMEGKHRDIALIRLASPVTGIVPAQLYAWDDELGQRVVFVGDGWTGTGLTGPSKGERIYRAARNQVSEVLPGWVNFIFDAPPEGDDLEGISGPGDSGGPALVEREGTLYVIGVSAYNDGGELCTYGTKEHYGRVSDEREWLDGVMAGTLDTTSDRRLLRHEETADGQGSVSAEAMEEIEAPPAVLCSSERVARLLVEALNAGDADAFRALFSEGYLEREGEVGIDGMLGFMIQAREARGDIVSIHPVESTALRVGEGEVPMVPVIWHLADGTSGYFGLVLAPDELITDFSLFVRKDICRAGAECAITVSMD